VLRAVPPRIDDNAPATQLAPAMESVPDRPAPGISAPDASAAVREAESVARAAAEVSAPAGRAASMEASQASAPAAEAPAKPAKRRVEWVDITKGTTIILVVLMHTVDALVAKGFAHEFWPVFNGYLQPIRMPLFFLAAGLFASGMIAMPWATLIRRRILPLLYLYVLWMVLVFAINNALPMEVRNTNMADPKLLVSSIVVPNNGLWFIYGLALYAVAAKALSALPVPVQFALAGSLAVYAEYFPVVSWTWNNVAKLFVFYLLGLHGRTLIFKFAALSNPMRVLVAGAAYWIVFTILEGTFLGELAVLGLVLSVAGVVAGVLVTSWWERFSFVGSLKYLGALTLPVYLMHDSLIKVYTFAMVKVADYMGNIAVQVLAPAAVTAAAVLGSLFLHHTLRAARMTWLFEMPKSWQGIRPAPAAAR
jgi:uncharacterized membrane protein YcfT